jgi:hypothetical protein
MRTAWLQVTARKSSACYAGFVCRLLSVSRRLKANSQSWLETSLERRWSSRRFPYGYLVTTSPQSLSSPWSAAPIAGWRTAFG